MLADLLHPLELRDVEIGIRGLASEDDRVRREKPRAQRRDLRHRARPRGGARDRFDEVQSGVKAIRLVTAEKERAVLRERAAKRSAELVLLKRRLRQAR